MAEEEQSTVKVTPFRSPMYNYGSSIIFLTNPDDDLHRLELVFRGLRDTGDTKKPYEKVGEPIMNKAGINSVIGQIRGLCSRNAILSNYDKNVIKQIMLSFADTLIIDLMMNRIKYGISESYDRNKILEISRNVAHSSLLRALMQGEKQFWKGSQQEIITRGEVTQRKPGLVSGILGWDRKT